MIRDLDILDVRDLIDRAEELENDLAEEFEIGDAPDVSELVRAKVSNRLDPAMDADDPSELFKLYELLDELQGNGGDHQWRGSWYPVSLIREEYFERYAEEFAEDIGAIKSNVSWPYDCIDWERAAKELQQDFSSVKYDGETYWYR